MLNIQQVNGAFTGFQARPASHLAALAVLGSLAFIAHEGIVSLVPGALAGALTVLFLAVAVLQWLALGRHESCVAGKDHDRADGVIVQSWIFGAIETALYAAGGLSLLAAEQVAVYNWIGISLAVAAGASAALINFRIKWASCDPVGAGKRVAPSNGGQRVHDVLFDAPSVPAIEAAPESDEGNILKFMKRIEHTHAKFDKDAAAAPARETPVRLRLAAKRIRVRAQRQAAAA
jgi:hypothetical protein